MPNAIIPLRRFKNLRCVVIGGNELTQTDATGYTEELHEMVRHNHAIESLTLQRPVMLGIDGLSSQDVLQDIFHGAPCQTSPTLRHLCLYGYSPKLNTITVPHLRCLIALDISYASWRTFDYQSIWDSMRIARIWLKDITVGMATESLSQYLKAYSGLEHFTARGRCGRSLSMAHSSRLRMVDEARQLSLDLWGTALPQHKASLVSYKCYNHSEMDAPSCITNTDILAFSEYANLQTLVFPTWYDGKPKKGILKLVCISTFLS